MTEINKGDLTEICNGWFQIDMKCKQLKEILNNFTYTLFKCTFHVLTLHIK